MRTLGVSVVCSVGVLVVGLATASAQAPIVPCEASPKVTEALRNMPAATGDSQADREARLAAFRALLKRFPSDAYLHQRYQDLAKQPTAANRDAVIAEYRALAARYPKDVGYRFLSARAQVGVNTKQVLPELETLATSVPRAHLTLVQIYQATAFKDSKKVRDHLQAFVKACPNSLAAYQYFDALAPSDFLTQGVATLRTLLQKRTDPESFDSWSTLWSLEFKLRPVTEHEALRKQVAEDVKRLRALNPGKSDTYYSTLEEGYKLAGDKDGEKWAVEQAKKASPQNANYAVRSQWYKEHPYPKPGDPPEKRKAYTEALVNASTDWARQWPNDPGIWFARVNALRDFDQASAADVEAAGEALLKAAAKNSSQFYFISIYGGSSYSLLVAHLYATKGVRADRLPALVKDGVAELSAPPPFGPPSDLYPRSSSEDPNAEYKEWYGNLTVADIWLKAKDKDRAREALTRVQATALKAKPKADVKDAAAAAKQWLVYVGRLGEYWQRMGDLAQLEGRKVDALTYYQNAVLARREPPAAGEKDELTEKTRAAWKDIGGTNEGWVVWADRKELFAQPNESAASSWTSIEKKLPEFQLTDLTGAKWDLAALKGKITMINVWAST